MGSQSVAPHPAPEAEELYRRWLDFLDEEFTRHRSPERRAEIVREQLYQLYMGQPHGGGTVGATLTSELPSTILLLSLDPSNVTLEAEDYPEIDPVRYGERKPLLWFWRMYDRSPVGRNLWLGLRFRAMLARHICRELGAGVRFSQGVDLTYGYNLSIGDGAVIYAGVKLGDRGGLEIGAGAIIGSYTRIFSHAHASEDYNEVTLVPTRIGAGARIASHAIVLAGHDVAEGAVVGDFPHVRG